MGIGGMIAVGIAVWVIAIVVGVAPSPPSWEAERREIKSKEEITAEKETMVAIKTVKTTKAIVATTVEAVKAMAIRKTRRHSSTSSGKMGSPAHVATATVPGHSPRPNG